MISASCDDESGNVPILILPTPTYISGASTHHVLYPRYKDESHNHLNWPLVVGCSKGHDPFRTLDTYQKKVHGKKFAHRWFLSFQVVHLTLMYVQVFIFLIIPACVQS